MKTLLNWLVGHAADATTEPSEFVPATVPGAVQLDWANAHDWPDYTVGDNVRMFDGLEDRYWLYRTNIERPAGGDGEKLFFVCGGVDYRFRVRLNGTVVHDQEGMFTPFEIDVTDQVHDRPVLEVLVWPAPKSVAEPADRVQANASCKPAVSYDWDFHPRLIPLGIWEETYLEVRQRVHIKSWEILSDVAEDYASGQLELNVHLSEPGAGTVRWTVSDPDGRAVSEQASALDWAVITLKAVVDAPRLWWPNGQGEAALYTSRVELLDEAGNVTQSYERRSGFRRVRLVMHPTAWDSPSDFPKTRSNPPITMEINGRRIFCKGSNWVAPSIFPGTITADLYRSLLQLAHDADMNILRLWGGAIVNKEAFYEAADKLGLMIWQEFPLACNDYEGTPEYLRVLDQESRSILLRLRRHPCIVIWCGGNELFNAWSGMTDQSLPLRLLNHNCYELAQHTPFLPTSPVMGMGHGPYMFRDPDGREIFQMIQSVSYTAYTEFGSPGPSSAETLRRIIPNADAMDIREGTPWQTHHAIGSWGHSPTTWMSPDLIEHYFGPAPDLDTLVERGQLLQSEGYKAIFQEARRQKPVCAMSLNWCFDEPWPTAANQSLVEWPDKPKPCYYAVAASCRPSLASARFPKFTWREDELFTAELWMLHDGPAPLPAGRVEAYLRRGDEDRLLIAWDFAAAPPNTNIPGPIVRHRLAFTTPGRMELILRVDDGRDLGSEYVVLYDTKQSHGASGTRKLNT